MKKLLLRQSKGFTLSSSKGFTLIELLVVVAIIGILSGVVITSLGAARKKAKMAVVKKAMTSFVTEAELGKDVSGYFSKELCYSEDKGNFGKIINSFRDSLGDPGSGWANIQIQCTTIDISGDKVSNTYKINLDPATSSLEPVKDWRIYAIVKNIRTGSEANIYCADNTGYSGPVTDGFNCGSWTHWNGVRCLCPGY